ncbi:MAG: ATP-binding protein [Verrucomicrobiota bacterium]|jgi:signal transduction histidine kinase
MRTLLVIAPNITLASAIRAALDSTRYRVLEHGSLREDEFRMAASSIDACLFDVDLTTVEPLRDIERLRRVLPQCPIILYTSESHRTWEEDAYLLGVNYILAKPVRGRLLNSLLDRLLAVAPPVEPLRPRPEAPHAPPASVAPGRMIETLRNYSSILSHSLSADALLKEFLLLLREILGVNRAAIFLRQSPRSLGGAGFAEGPQILRSACAVGLSPGLLERFELSLDGGIGGAVFRSGRILRRESDEVERDPLLRREFDLLGARVAIPVLDRESLVGVAVFDDRITGEPMANEDLALIFHLLEQLGLAIKNIWWHEQVSARHQMMFDILRNIKTGCVVIGRELNTLHANDMARLCFPRAGRSTDAFDFSDLPQSIGSKVFELLKTGQAVPDFKYQPPGQPQRRYQISITPFGKDGSALPTAVLVVVEDCTAADRIHHLEMETANLRLVQQMAERLAHEIGNAVVPLSTHQQLLAQRGADPEFQQSLAGAMEESVKRVTRLVDQMRFLARDHIGRLESVPVKQLIEEALRQARAYHPATTVLLQYESSGEPLTLSCDRQGLQHAFTEIILNALQAGAPSCQIQVRTRSETDANGSRWARIEVQDSGGGFSAEAAGKASEPFYTTRKVGLGLGLAVTNKIIQTHSGKMEIPAPRGGSPGVVRVSLPLGPAAPSSPAAPSAN